jgi:hypothetical protein
MTLPGGIGNNRPSLAEATFMPILAVKTPEFSESVQNGTLLEWRCQEGEFVNRDEVLADLETDKVILEVTAPASGVLRRRLVEAGAEVNAGQVPFLARAISIEPWWPRTGSNQASIDLPLMRQTVETVVGAITKFWDDHGAKIMRIVGNFMSIVSTIFDTYLKNAFDIVKTIMQLITGDFEGAGETVRGIFERTFSSIVEIIGLQLDNVRTLITGIDWGALGRSIIQGIANGISAAHELVVSAMVGAAQGAIDAAKRLLGINSPSKVMADEVGGPMAQGIAQGFQRAIGQADFSMPRLDFGFGVDAMMPTVMGEGQAGGGSAGAGSGSGGGQQNYFTFNIVASDQQAAKAGVLSALRQAGVAFA